MPSAFAYPFPFAGHPTPALTPPLIGHQLRRTNMNFPDLSPDVGPPAMNLTVALPRPSDVSVLVETMRKEDAEELKALGHSSLLTCIQESLAMSEQTGAVFDGDTLLCIFGVARHGDWGFPWMLTSQSFSRWHMRDALPFTKDLLSGWASRYPLGLFNIVHTRNHKPKRWLRWMGFDVSKDADYTAPSGERFHSFRMNHV